jgi:hypothetical protein
MSDPAYYICGKCYQIEPTTCWSRDANGQFKCIHCQTANKSGSWPSAEIMELFTFISSYDTGSSHYGQVISVFSSSLLELMLEELVTKMAYEDLTYDQGCMLVEALLDAHQGRSRLFSLYKRIGYSSFHEAVQRLGQGEFIANWDKIVEVRNKVVHGKIQEGNQITASLIKKTLDDALEVFSFLHNEYNKESLDYKYATKSE